MLKISVYTTFALLIVFMCSQCGPKRGNRVKHDFAASEEFKKLSRPEQVKKCGSCHQEIYRNEMMGPHSHALSNLEAHINFVGGKGYDYQPYKDIVNHHNGPCYNCHASKNIYESVFAVDESDYNFNLSLLGKKRMIQTRDAADQKTGVDCITCHFDGEGVVTGENFKATANAGDCPGYCNPIASKFFSSNDNCQPCHSEQFYNVRVFNRTNQLNLTCASCHEEKDMAGKYMHYTFWAHDPAGKVKPDNLNLFNTLEASYVPASNAVKIVWFNKYLPHKVSVCTELVAFIAIKNNGEIIKYDTIRLNRRSTHLKEIAGAGIDIKTFPGIQGYEFKGLNDSVIRMISLPAGEGDKKYNISITGIKKEQYWLNDSINTIYFRKELPL